MRFLADMGISQFNARSSGYVGKGTKPYIFGKSI